MALWKEVNGYEGLYLVSDEGQIYSLPRKVSNKRGNYVRKGRLLKPGLRGKAGMQYEFVILNNGVSSKHESVHRIVAMAFVDNPHSYGVVNHIDHNTRNNKASNLEWCTQQYNNEYGHNKSVKQYDTEGNLLAEYKSITIASNMSGIKRTAINNCLKGWSKTAGGYIWKYSNINKEG